MFILIYRGQVYLVFNLWSHQFSSYKKSNKLNFYRKEVIDEVMVKEAQDLKNEVTVGMLLALCLFENHLLRLGSRGLDGQLLWPVAEIPVGSF